MNNLSGIKRVIAITFSVFLILGALFFSISNLIFYERDGETEKRSRKEYSTISTQYLGEYLADKYPLSRAIIIYDATSTSVVMQERLNGLRKGLEGKIPIFKEIGLPKELPKGVPLRMINARNHIYAEDFNNIMKKYPNVNMIISLVGLPKDSANMKIWQIDDPKKRPKFVMFGGNARKLAPAIKGGYINALVQYRKMGKSVNELPPEDIEEAFNRRFRLLTPEFYKNKLAADK